MNKSDRLNPDIVGTIGFVRRLGSPRSSVDIQLYLGAGTLVHSSYYYQVRNVYDNVAQELVKSTYLKKDGRDFELCLDFGMRFGLEYSKKFGWFNFTLGGMYVPGLDHRFYLTGGVSLGNALVAGALVSYLGLPQMFL